MNLRIRHIVPEKKSIHDTTTQYLSTKYCEDVNKGHHALEIRCCNGKIYPKIGNQIVYFIY